jgi:1-deoxy-D-xylulose-5-phosphate synthase
MGTLLERAGVPGAVRDFTLEELHHVADEIRERVIDVVTQTGGHMGSNLGVVELTLALHHVFDVRKDTFIWDVSNQTYIHKILTGRNDRLPTLRQYGGLSGFGFKTESEFDPFSFGHAGTSLSTALGVAVGADKLDDDRYVIATIGDGSMPAGVAYEALNQTGHIKPSNLIFVLNDNGMSIAPSVGALNEYLAKFRTAPLYEETKKEIHRILKSIPVIGEHLDHTFDNLRESVKAHTGGLLFEELGVSYYGPVDGHDLRAMISTFESIRKLDRPVLLHLITQKGKGHPDAETNYYRVHAVSPSKKDSKIPPKKPTSSRPRFTKIFSDEMIKIALDDPNVVALTAAMPDGTGLDRFAELLPEQFYDVGMCEQHGVAFASGLATAGLKPFVTIYSTFLQRGYDMVMQELCLQDLDVVIPMDRGGIAGNDGPTHHGLYDIAFLRTLPNTILLAPKDEPEFRAMLRFCHETRGITCIRYPRATVPDPEAYGIAFQPIEYGKAEVLREGEDAVIIAYGIMNYHALAAADLLANRGLQVGVINARFAKPIDVDTIGPAFEQYPRVYTLEDHSLQGGFGSAVAETVLDAGYAIPNLTRLGVPDEFIEHGDRDVLMEALGLDAQSLANRIEAECKGLVETAGAHKNVS